MAFVSLGAGSLFGKSLGNVQQRAVDSKPTSMVMYSTVPPQQAFSSIDMPERATIFSDSSVATREDVLYAAYKQVFGNCYIMESERAELAKAESDFKGNTLSIRELVRAMAKSEAYRKRFFARAGPYRFVELNCKHLLGRAPNSQEEVSEHVKILMNEGYDAEIDSYIDSLEYETKFGDFILPRFIFQGAYEKNDHFNRMMIMRKHWDGCSTSTVSGSTAPAKPIPAQLTMGYDGYVNGSVGVTKGLPAGFRPLPEPKKLAPVPLNANAPVRMRIKIAENLYQVYEIPPLMTKDIEPEWKKEKIVPGKRNWNGVWF